MMMVATQQPDDDHELRAAPEGAQNDMPAKIREEKILAFRLRSGASGAIFGKALTSPALSALGNRLRLSIQATGPNRARPQATWFVQASWDGVCWQSIGAPLKTSGVGVQTSGPMSTEWAFVRVRVSQEQIDPRVKYDASLVFTNEKPAGGDGEVK